MKLIGVVVLTITWSSLFFGLSAAFATNVRNTPVRQQHGSTIPRMSLSSFGVSSARSTVWSQLRGGAAAATTSGPHHQSLVLVGNISLFFKVLLTRSGSALEQAVTAFGVSELIPILALSFLPEIVLRFVSQHIVNKTVRRRHPLPFEETPHLSRVSRVLCQIGQLGLLVYFGEVFLVFLCGLGVPGVSNRSRLLASFVYGSYVTRSACNLKNNLVDRAFRRYGRNWAARKTLANRVFDAAIYLIATIIFLDFNNIEVGVALKSLLTLGGVSTAVVGLALKEPATEIIQGTSILLANKFSTGDVIKLSDGTSGQVQELKWTDSTIRGSDNSFVRIPHTHMAKQRVVNLSRQPSSQVSQKLNLPNRGSTQIKQLIQDIKNEIRNSCPMLIDDDAGARSFLVHWTDIEKDNAIITIESHFRIPRLSSKYWDNRQEVLMAISRAVEAYNGSRKEAATQHVKK